jgi:hypothetical protein
MLVDRIELGKYILPAQYNQIAKNELNNHSIKYFVYKTFYLPVFFFFINFSSDVFD